MLNEPEEECEKVYASEDINVQHATDHESYEKNKKKKYEEVNIDYTSGHKQSSLKKEE